MNNKMGSSNRGVSIVGGALVVVAVVVLVIGLFFIGTAGQGGDGQDTQDGLTPTATTVPGTATVDSTESTPAEPTNIQSTTSGTSTADIQRFEEHFVQRIEARNSDITVIDVETVENTVYVSAQGPNEGGWAQATNDDLAEAFTDALEVDWSNKSVSFGIDHAVVALYDGSGNLFWNARIEESWAYRYYSNNLSLNKFTNFVLRSGHSDTQSWINTERFTANISALDGVESLTIEQYASTYFIKLESGISQGSNYKELIFKISEALRNSRTSEKIVYLQYVIYNDNSAVISNHINTAWGDSWKGGDISLMEYKEALVMQSYNTNRVPGGIGSMITRRTPFPADPPPE